MLLHTRYPDGTTDVDRRSNEQPITVWNADIGPMCCTQPRRKGCGNFCKDASEDVKDCPAGYSEQWAPATLSIRGANAGRITDSTKVVPIARMVVILMTWGFLSEGRRCIGGLALVKDDGCLTGFP